ncbi:ankyrin repeat domain-containing protein [Fluviicola taffensis]|uniref:ankyrin repeat domain-containing protein n=1 Tax=Fluviicola taffensis TaxID=191579 RepID=UPI003137D535
MCLLFAGFSAHSQDVFESARTGNIKQLKKLISLNKDTIQKVNSMGFDPLMIACYRGQTKCAVFLIEHGADVNRPSAEGSALQAACYQNNTDLARLLIAKGAQLNIQGPDGNTALMYAVLNQNEKLVDALRKAGADLELKNKDGQTAYSLAMTQSNSEIQKLVQLPR